MDASRATEQLNPATTDLDILSTAALLELLVNQQLDSVRRCERAVCELAPLIDACVQRLDRQGRLVYVGAGTSGRLAEADLAELTPTFGVSPDRLEIVRPPVGSSEDDVATLWSKLANLHLTKDDVVVALSASGSTPWAMTALEIAGECGALRVLVANNRPKGCDDTLHMVFLNSGPEPIVGSTRMSAGLAQKLFLTTFSTAIMVRLGLTFGNLMTQATGDIQKLRGRRVSIVSTATGLATEEAVSALEEADGDVEIAILAHRGHLTVPAARALRAGSNSLRSALDTTT